MSASILDPRMIDQLKPLTVSNTNFINITAAFISVPGATSNDWTDTYDIVKSLSSDWDSVFNLVQALSSDWEESLLIGEISATNFDLLTSVNDLYTFLETNSASWEESADILPTVTNYLSTDLVTVSSLNVTQQLLSGNSDLFNLFLTPDNTLTTSVCSISGDGVTPFVMNFTNGLLTSITF